MISLSIKSSIFNDHRYTVPEAAETLGIRANLLYGWKQQFEDNQSGAVLADDERSELMKLRMEKEILKKASAFFAREMK